MRSWPDKQGGQCVNGVKFTLRHVTPGSVINVNYLHVARNGGCYKGNCKMNTPIMAVSDRASIIDPVPSKKYRRS